MAFDVKKVSVQLGEDMVKSVVSQVVIPYVKDLIEASPNKSDDLILMFLPQLEAGLLELVDKIDGEKG